MINKKQNAITKMKNEKAHKVVTKKHQRFSKSVRHNLIYRWSSSCIGRIISPAVSIDIQIGIAFIAIYSRTPMNTPAMTSLTWCRPSITRDIQTTTAQTTITHAPVSPKSNCDIKKQLHIATRVAWPLGKEYLSTEIVNMSLAFWAGRLRRKIPLTDPHTMISTNNATIRNTQISVPHCTQWVEQRRQHWTLEDRRDELHTWIQHTTSTKMLNS